jgi:hypothetical protein
VADKYSMLTYYTGLSLVDITHTGVTRSNDADDLKRNQQRNWETLIQCLGLRCQVQDIKGPIVVDTDLELLEFGDLFEGDHKVWVWTWAVETPEVYTNKDPLDMLLLDFEQVPVVTYLEETARFMLPIFYPHGSIKNVYFKQGQFDLNSIV